MPINCPPKHLKEYQELEDSLGKENTYRAWIAHGEEMPSLEEARKLIQHMERVDSALKGKIIDAEVDKIVNELGTSLTPEHPINKVVDDYFEKLREQVKKLVNNKNYAKLKELLSTDDEDKTALASTKELMKRAKESIDGIDGTREKVKAIAAGVIQSGKILDLMHESLDDLLKTPESSKENFPVTQSFLQLGRVFDEFLKATELSLGPDNSTFQKEIDNSLRKIRSLEEKVLESDKSGSIQILSPIISPALADRQEKLESQIEVQKKNLAKAISKGDTKWQAAINEDIARKEALLKYTDFRIKDEALAYLDGDKGDANISFLFESFRSSPDYIVSGFAQWLRQNFNDVDNEVLPIEVEYSKAIAPHMEKLGLAYRIDPEKLGDAITYEEELLNSQGEVYKELCYLGKFKGAELELIKLDQAIDKVQSDYDTETDPTKKESLKKALYKAEDALDREKTTYWNRLYTPSMQEALANLWRNDLGRDLKEQTTRIWNGVRAIDALAKVRGYVTEDELSNKDSLIREYQMLANVNNPDGTKKTGKSLEIANRMQEVRTFNQEHYEWSLDQKMFDDAKDSHSDYLVMQKNFAKDSSEYENAMQDWLDKNTVNKITDEFYEEQTALYEAKAAILDGTKDQESQDSVSELNDEVTGLLKGNRDENNQPIGILIAEKGSERIRNAEEKIYELKRKEKQNSGLSNSEWSNMIELIKKKQSRTINLSERNELDTIFAKLKSKSLSSTDRKELAEINAELEALRSFRPTEYYVDTHNEISSKYGVVINDLGQVQEGAQAKDLVDSKVLTDLLVHEDYENWFKLNHYKVDDFDPELNYSTKKWKRTRQWTKVVPNDPKYFEQVPSKKYSQRKLKPEYLNGYDPVAGKVDLKVGEQIDNKGNWLPRETVDKKYSNPAYTKLLSDNSEHGKALAALLNITYKDHLKNQEGVPNDHKLWNRVPRMRKRTRERLFDLRDIKRDPKGFTKRVKEDFKALIGTEKEYTFGTGNYEDELKASFDQEKALNKAQGATGKVDDELVPVRFKGKIDINDVSRNIPTAHLKYAHALKLASRLNDMTPIQQGLTNILSKSNTPLKKQLGVVTNSAHRNRLLAINRIVEKHFLGKSKAYELKKGIDVGLGWLKSLTGFAMLETRLPTTLGNVAKWTMENFVDAGNGVYTEADWAAGLKVYASWQSALGRQYISNKIDDIPWQAQLDAVMKPKQTIPYEAVIGERPLQTKVTDTLGLNWLKHHREWADYFTQKSLQLAMMNATKIERKMPDGTTKVIPYHDAWELSSSGHLKLKDGIDKAWAVGGESYNRFLVTQDAINARINGFLDNFDQSYLQQYTSYAALMFLRGWLVGSWLNHWSAAELRVDKKRLALALLPSVAAGAAFAHQINPEMGIEIFAFLSIFASGAFKSIGRFSLGTGQWWGRYPALLDMIAQKYDAGIKSFIPEKLGGTNVEFSNYQKGVSREALKALGGILFLNILGSILIGATDFAGFGRKFDEDNRDVESAKRNLKNLSYWQKLALFEFLRLETQTATFSSIDQHLAFLTDVSVLFSTIKDLYHLGVYSLSDVSDTQRQVGSPPEKVARYTKPLENITGVAGLKESLGSEEALERSIMSYERMRVR